MRKTIVVLLIALAVISCGPSYKEATATKYHIAHQGGYIGEATVTVNAKQEVVSASYSEWQGPSGWAENNSEDGKSLVDGAVVRVPDPTANTGSSDPQIKGYMFYIYMVNNGVDVWGQYTPGDNGFSRPTRHFDRDWAGMMSNPIRAAAYAKAAREDKLVNVTIEGTKVIVGKPASQTVHYGKMDKSDPKATYMGLNASSIGYRYNVKALLDFFKAHPTADYASAKTVSAKIQITEDKTIDANAKAADYTAEADKVWAVADAVSGATYSDFPHYALELQEAYKDALAAQLVDF